MSRNSNKKEGDISSFIRKKYGAPESRKDLLLRLKDERELLDRKNELLDIVSRKNKNEFHFGFYSAGKSKVVGSNLAALKKKLKRVDSEIARGCRKTGFSTEKVQKDFEIYIKELKEKRGVIVQKMESLNKK